MVSLLGCVIFVGSLDTFVLIVTSCKQLELEITLMWIQTPMLEVYLKCIGCKRLKLTEYFWHGPCASLFFLCDHCSLFFGFCVSFLLSLRVALHYIHAFHSRCFFFLLYIYIYIYIYKGRKRKHIMFLHYSFCFWKQGWSIYFHMTCLLYFV